MTKKERETKKKSFLKSRTDKFYLYD